MHVCKTLESPYEMIEKINNKKWCFLIKNRTLNRQNYKRVFILSLDHCFIFMQKKKREEF